MPVIHCKNIVKRYPMSLSGRKRKTALDDLSLSVNLNEVFGIVGPNGAGKSTILKILLGFVRPDSGIAFINEQPVSQYICHRTLGYLPENPGLYSHLSLADHLRFAARTAGMSAVQTRKRIDELAETVGLSHVLKLPIKNYSKGMTQRSALASALFLEPEILILDEPMSGLDPFGRQLVIDIIREYHGKGTTILLCSHSLTDVERICTKIAIMNNGALAAVTTPDELHSSGKSPRKGMTLLESYFFEILTSKTP